MDSFTQAYVDAALACSTDNSTPSGGYSLAKNYGIDNIDPDTLAKMEKDCQEFQEANADDISEETYIGSARYDSDEMAGHDFWLTRNGHGAGFWDGDWEDEAGERMSESAKSFGTFDLYIGDDGKIYGG